MAGLNSLSVRHETQHQAIEHQYDTDFKSGARTTFRSWRRIINSPIATCAHSKHFFITMLYGWIALNRLSVRKRNWLPKRRTCSHCCHCCQVHGQRKENWRNSSNQRNVKQSRINPSYSNQHPIYNTSVPLYTVLNTHILRAQWLTFELAFVTRCVYNST